VLGAHDRGESVTTRTRSIGAVLHDMPRSLAVCMNEVVANLELVANLGSGEALRRAGRLHSDLRYDHGDEILATGLQLP